MLRHNYRPQVASVPVSILLAWPAVVYLFYRGALLVAPAGAGAAAVTAVAATLVDAITDPILLDRGAWEYPEWVLSEPRFRGVPWWNFVGWLAITFVTALLPTFAVA
jgi:putative membrane protein